MPVYNGERFLGEAIDSILNQTFRNFVFVIIDDASTDRTAAIIEKYAHSDNRIQHLKNNNNYGAAKSRNIGLDLSRTELIAFMDADDVAVPTRFEKQINFFKTHPEVGLCGSWFTYIGKKNKVIDHNEHHDKIKVDFLSHCPIQLSTVMLCKSSLDDLRFDENMIVAEDYSFFSQLIAKTKFHNIQESLIFYRWHEENISHTEGEKFEALDFKVRARQLEHLEITATNPDLKHYVYAISLKKNEDKQSIIKTVNASKKLIANNRRLNYFDPQILENHIDNTIIRTLRNARKYDVDFFKYIKNESGYFGKMPLIDIVSIFLKSYL